MVLVIGIRLPMRLEAAGGHASLSYFTATCVTAIDKARVDLHTLNLVCCIAVRGGQPILAHLMTLGKELCAPPPQEALKWTT